MNDAQDIESHDHLHSDEYVHGKECLEITDFNENDEDLHNYDNEVEDDGHTFGDYVLTPHTPYIGQEFPSAESAYEFYKNFALIEGFGIRRNTKDIKRRVFVCTKEGHKRLNLMVEEGRDIKRRRETREDCKAHMTIGLNKKEVWVVTKYTNDHTHPMIETPKKKYKIRPHAIMHKQSSCKALIDQLHGCGIGPAKISRVINSTSGRSSVNVTPQQCIDHLRGSRKSNLGKEFMTIAYKFLERKKTELAFFSAFELDESFNCRSNMFWADSRSRTTYHQFSDVIVFDVTYKTNNLSMHFSPFTGVNHHRQSTLFGCVLLADETEKTFVWLFEQWLKCMDNKAPGAIITDQDPAIRNAIRIVFPETHHRYCSWHLALHEDEHIRSLRCAYSDFYTDYTMWAKRSRTIEESEKNWIILKDKYKKSFNEPLDDKQKNIIKSWRWLDSMYEQRKQWVKAYLKTTFFAGMKSSQRSESINAYFDGFVSSTTPVNEFIDQYDKALLARRDKEEKEDFVSMTTKPDSLNLHPFDAHAGTIYTRNTYGLFQEESKLASNCSHKKLKKEAEDIVYEVEYRTMDKVVNHVVEVSCSTSDFKCSCAKFETAGLICKHIIYLIKQKFKYTQIPQKYILSRWTLASRYRSAYDGDTALIECQSNFKFGKPTPLQKWKTFSYLMSLYEKASEYGGSLDMLQNYMIEACKGVDEFRQSQLQTTNVPSSSTNSLIPSTQDFIGSSNIVIRDPSKCKTKGRPRTATRFVSGIQSCETQTKGSRACKICRTTGHNSKTCPNKSSIIDGSKSDMLGSNS